jgi:hypothetical protein
VPRPGLRRDMLRFPRESLLRRLTRPGIRSSFFARILPSCSGGLQSICLDDLTPCWLGVTASAFARAGPRGRVIEVMQRGETLHPPLLSLPSRSECSLVVSRSPAATLTGEPVRGALPTTLPPPGLRLPAVDRSPRRLDVMLFASLEFTGPSTFYCSRSDSRSSKTLASLSRTLGYLPSFAAPSGFRTPSTLSSATCLPALFRAGTVLGLPPFGGFSPIVAPAASRPPVSSLSFHRLRGRDFEDVSIDRMRCRRFAWLALTTLAPPLVVLPFEVSTSTVLPCASARLLSWASPVSVVRRAHPLLGSLVVRRFSSCSSEFHRSEKATRTEPPTCAVDLEGSPSLGSLPSSVPAQALRPDRGACPAPPYHGTRLGPPLSSCT